MERIFVSAICQEQTFQPSFGYHTNQIPSWRNKVLSIANYSNYLVRRLFWCIKIVACHCANGISKIQGMGFYQSYIPVAHADSFRINNFPLNQYEGPFCLQCINIIQRTKIVVRKWSRLVDVVVTIIKYKKSIIYHSI